MTREFGSGEAAAAWIQPSRRSGRCGLRLPASRGVVEGVSELVALGLRDPTQRRTTLLLLANLDPVVVLAALDDLVPIALNDRDAVLVRQVLGRLAHADLSSRLPPIIWLRLESADDHDVRRFGELFDHLGLLDELKRLRHWALMNGDPTIREVGKDFRR